MIRHIPRATLTEPASELQLVPHALAPAAAQPAPNRQPGSATQLSLALVALLGEELRLRPEHIESVVTRELSRVRRAQSVELRLHPADLPLLPPLGELCQRQELRGALSATADTSVERGGCVLVSNLGEIDARLETRLALALTLLRSGWPT